VRKCEAFAGGGEAAALDPLVRLRAAIEGLRSLIKS
jgi:hypothetical protein